MQRKRRGRKKYNQCSVKNNYIIIKLSHKTALYTSSKQTNNVAIYWRRTVGHGISSESFGWIPGHDSASPDGSPRPPRLVWSAGSPCPQHQASCSELLQSVVSPVRAHQTVFLHPPGSGAWAATTGRNLPQAPGGPAHSPPSPAPPRPAGGHLLWGRHSQRSLPDRCSAAGGLRVCPEM